MNDDLKEQAKARIDEALKQTQIQTEEAASQLGGLLRAGIAQVRKAADAAADAIRSDINGRG